MKVDYKLTLNYGKAGRTLPDEVLNKYNLCENQTPRFGYYWWFWMPRCSHNSGRVSRSEIVDINFNWLCYWWSVTAWPTSNNNKPTTQQVKS